MLIKDMINVSWLVRYFLLITIILDFDKHFATICPRWIYEPSLCKLPAEKYNFIIIVRQVLSQKMCKVLVRSTVISIFYLSML